MQILALSVRSDSTSNRGHSVVGRTTAVLELFWQVLPPSIIVTDVRTHPHTHTEETCKTCYETSEFCDLSGFRNGVYKAAIIGNPIPTFRENVMSSFSRFQTSFRETSDSCMSTQYAVSKQHRTKRRANQENARGANL